MMQEQLFPEVSEPKAKGRIHLDDTHSLYFEEYGNDNGVPVIVLHGGPGAGCSKVLARYFNPNHYRIILYDQRASGKSTPWSSIKNNTTHHLIEDLDQLRRHFVKDKKVLLFGGSWGSTLAILYAQTYPDKVSGLILRGLFLGRREDARAYLQENSQAAIHHNKDWIVFKSQLFEHPELNYSDEKIVQALSHKITNSNEAVWQPVSNALADWESIQSRHHKKESTGTINGQDKKRSACKGRITAHYIMNDFFLTKNQIIKNISTLSTIKSIYIIHGLHDNVCSVKQALDFFNALQKISTEHLAIQLTDAGHRASDEKNISALINASNHFIKKMTSDLEIQSASSKSPLRFFEGALTPVIPPSDSVSLEKTTLSERSCNKITLK